MSLSNLLETGNFREFWKESANSRDLLNSVHGFDDAIRNCTFNFVRCWLSVIANLVSITYETIEKQSFAELVNLKGTELENFLNSRKYKHNEEGYEDSFLVDIQYLFPNCRKCTKEQKTSRASKISRFHYKIFFL